MEEFITELLNIYSTITPEQLKSVGIVLVFHFLLLCIYSHATDLLFELNEKKYKRNKLKFLTHDDVLILDELLSARYPSENIEKDIARIMINAKKKDEKLEIIRKERWIKLWKKDK